VGWPHSLALTHGTSTNHRPAGTICVPVRPELVRRRCAASASSRDANGPETTCCQPFETRRRIGSPSAPTCAATDPAGASVRKEATTISKRPLAGAGTAAGGVVAPAGAVNAVAGAAFGTGVAAAGGSGRGLGARVAGAAGAAAGEGASATGDRPGRTMNQVTTAASATGIATARYFATRGGRAGRARKTTAAVWSAPGSAIRSGAAGARRSAPQNNSPRTGSASAAAAARPAGALSPTPNAAAAV
jgi:hypothetical protein